MHFLAMPLPEATNKIEVNALSGGRSACASNALFQKYRSLHRDYVVFSKPVVLQLPQPLLINLE